MIQTKFFLYNIMIRYKTMFTRSHFTTFIQTPNNLNKNKKLTLVNINDKYSSKYTQLNQSKEKKSKKYLMNFVVLLNTRSLLMNDFYINFSFRYFLQLRPHDPRFFSLGSSNLAEFFRGGISRAMFLTVKILAQNIGVRISRISRLPQILESSDSVEL